MSWCARVFPSLALQVLHPRTLLRPGQNWLVAPVPEQAVPPEVSKALLPGDYNGALCQHIIRQNSASRPAWFHDVRTSHGARLLTYMPRSFQFSYFYFHPQDIVIRYTFTQQKLPKARCYMRHWWGIGNTHGLSGINPAFSASRFHITWLGAFRQPLYIYTPVGYKFVLAIK